MKLTCMLKWLCLYLLLLMLQARKLAEAEKLQAASRPEKQLSNTIQLMTFHFKRDTHMPNLPSVLCEDLRQ